MNAPHPNQGVDRIAPSHQLPPSSGVITIRLHNDSLCSFLELTYEEEPGAEGTVHCTNLRRENVE